MIDGEKLSMWRMLRSWWQTSSVRPVDLILNNRVVAGFHLTNVRQRLPIRYRHALLHLVDMYQKGLIKPRIDSVWTFSQVCIHNEA